MSEEEQLKQEVAELRGEVETLSFAVTRLTELVTKIDANYHELTDKLVLKALQRMNQEKEG